ncbi:DUF6193 family natural product biosynthesis protein [Streptomyces griseocarneus]|uniref:DUF6193 family natural product biosynthesis protein n=1 Tax=Streptomyces griseocarneus TaxID=51201 RepID=UPI00167F0054|nr:DUF6193 family natural product biosynthesis protein [Streptomyces griseocarneus]MBZ6475425.1 DUF6193 family natural product biosynthesis protein [Streptomyces griseocarneus]GHG75171.1 hypothetical protein GCM10018779_52580 [Streptomyces griseocarneus]
MALGDQETELVQRMEHIALAQGVDLGDVRAVSGWNAGAEVATDRGEVRVTPQGEGTRFRVSIHGIGVFVWSEGWTNDLVAAVGVAGLWRRGGTLRELHAHFPFMSCSELAQAVEDGDPVPTKWRQLLSSEWCLEKCPFLKAAHAHPELRVFYPDISMGSLILSRRPFDSTSGLVKITPLGAGNYRVGSTWQVESAREVSSLNEALEVAAACFGSFPEA